MRELDTLLMAYVDRWYVTAPVAEQAAFRILLSLPDPEILSLLTGRLGSDDEHIARVVERVLGERIS
jgi:succinate dehydrogenase flavin-adding protein (antitoxin of CptAB toxin-antitoxin module)